MFTLCGASSVGMVTTISIRKDIAANILVFIDRSDIVLCQRHKCYKILNCFTLVELVGAFLLLLLVHQVSQYH